MNMKRVKVTAIVFMAIFTAYTCFAASSGVPEKYNLDSQMQKVTEISKYNFMSWQTVDKQSFVLQTSPSDYYLIVLSNPSDKIMFAETIKIADTNAMVKPGYNNVIVKGNGFTDTYIINKIYKFKDSAQIKTITAQLTGEKK
jgi:hypothetical protein